MARGDEPLVRLRSAVRLMNRVPEHPVVAPVALAGKIRDRHQLERGHAVVRHRHADELQHQNSPTSPTRNRSMPRIAIAVIELKRSSVEIGDGVRVAIAKA